MPRKPFTCDPTTPYHLSARSNNREWFDLPIELIWDRMSDYLHFIHYAFGVRIHSFVLMNNHFHLIASFPEANLSAAMEYYMRETSRLLAREANRINHVYGSRIFRSRLSSFQYFETAYKYLYRNPVEAGLCERPTAYPYSTLMGLLGHRRLTIPVEEDTLLFANVPETLSWLNRSPLPEDRDAVRKALRRAEFKFPRDGLTRKRNRLEDARY